MTPREDAFERLGRARAARRMRRRVGSALVALAVAGVGIAVAVSALGGSTAVPANGQQTYRDPESRWTIDYPTGWHFASFSDSARDSAFGIRIANFEVPGGTSEQTGPTTTIPDMSFLRSFPSDGVLVQLWQIFGGPVGVDQRPDNPFPVSTADLAPIRPYVGGSEPAPLFASVDANGETYALAVWIAPHASAEERSAIEEVVGSWRFLPLQEGTVIGHEIDFYVLGTPDDYPIGSVTRFDQSNLQPNPHGVVMPFYLVHVREGLYAVAGTHQDCDGVLYDQASRQFACPDGPRWSLDGQLLSNPDPKRFPYDHLDIPMVRISLDGHVLATPEAFVDSAATDLWLTGGGEPEPSPTPSPSPSYPRGAFQWCPDPAGTVPHDQDAAVEATDVAIKFSEEYAAGNMDAARALADEGAFDNASWAVSGSPTAIRPIGAWASAAAKDELVAFGCGPDVAAVTYEVKLDDGTDSSSLDFTLYLIQRSDGWKVWGSY